MNAVVTEPLAQNETQARRVDLLALFRESGIADVLDELDRDLIGLAPVKTRIREIAA
ncbi:CbbX protein, partial [Burkholderia sp. SIMBA_051]